MSYTPKHAKPASAKKVAPGAYRRAFTEAVSGRHARPGKGQRTTSRRQATDVRIPRQRSESGDRQGDAVKVA